MTMLQRATSAFLGRNTDTATEGDRVEIRSGRTSPTKLQKPKTKTGKDEGMISLESPPVTKATPRRANVCGSWTLSQPFPAFCSDVSRTLDAQLCLDFDFHWIFARHASKQIQGQEGEHLELVPLLVQRREAAAQARRD